MPKNVFAVLKVMLIVHFASGSRSPLTSALGRIALAYMGSSIFGNLLAKAARRADLPLGLPVAIGLMVVVGLGFLVSGLVMLTMAGSQTLASRSAAFSKMIWLAPLSLRLRWLVDIAPSAIILGTIALLLGLPIRAAASGMELPATTLQLGWFLGLLSGYGLMLLNQPRRILNKGVIYVAVVSFSVWLLDVTLQSETLRAQTLLSYFAVAILLVPLVGVYQSLRSPKIAQPIAEFATTKQLLPDVLPHSAWFLLKVWRNKRTRSSLLLASGFSLFLAVSMVLRRTVISDPYAVAIVGAILAATFSCDVRGVMRRHQPPEVVLVRGVKGMVRAEAAVSGLLGLIIGLPLFVSLVGHAQNPWNFFSFFISLQLFSSFAGLLASTILVPATGEIGSQFLSATLATSALVAFPKFAGLTNVAYAQQSQYWLLASVGLGGITFLIESQRRNHYGHS